MPRGFSRLTPSPKPNTDADLPGITFGQCVGYGPSFAAPIKQIMKPQIRNLIPLSIVGALALVIPISSASAAGDKPNIIYIVADDLGWKDVGFNGATDIRTPNIDKLAATGAKFSQF